jgi:hypothetical protein
MRSIDVVTLRRLTSKAAEIQTSNRTRPCPSRLPGKDHVCRVAA